MNTITIADARNMGAKGAEPTEAERILFEAWMAGHCWAVGGEWDGQSYRNKPEHAGHCDTQAMLTRQIWAAWRDRAALDSQAVTAQVATMIFPKHSPDKPFIALGDCANLYPDAAQTKPLYTTPPATQTNNPLLNDYVQKAIDADRAKWKPVLQQALVALTTIKQDHRLKYDHPYIDSAIAEIEATGVKA